MATFTPDTYTVPLNDEEVGHAARFSMWRHYGAPIPVGYSVLITSGAATTAPGTISPTTNDIADADAGSGEGGKAWFRGGITYTITSAEQTILCAAGYDNDHGLNCGD